MSTSTVKGYEIPGTTQEWYIMAVSENEKIVTREHALISVATEVESTRRMVATIEADTAADVAAEQDGNGKARFSNETSRKAEIARRLAESDGYAGWLQRLRDAELKQRVAQIELSEAQRLFSLAKAGLNTGAIN